MRPGNRSARSIFRSLKRELDADSTFSDRVHGRSQRCYFWMLRTRGKIVTAWVMAFLYTLWGSKVAVFNTPEPIAVLVAWSGITLVALGVLQVASSNSIATNSVTALTPLPDSRIWNEYYSQQLCSLLWLAPGVVICFYSIVNTLGAATWMKLVLVVLGVLAHMATCILVAQLIVRVRWLAQWSGWWQLGIGSLIGLAFVGLSPWIVERVASIFPALWLWPPSWPAIILARPPAGVGDTWICVTLAAMFFVALFVLVRLAAINARRYRAVEVYSWNEGWYVYGFSPLLCSAADVQAYDSWADSLLDPDDGNSSDGNSDGDDIGDGFSDQPSNLDAWLEEEHTTEQQRWAEMFAKYPLKLLSIREREILRVRCIESSGVFQFSWKQTAWRTFVLAAVLALLPEQASIVGCLALSWILFGPPLVAIYQGGFARYRSLPYRLEHILASESKYRVLVAATLWLPIQVVTCLLGIRSGLSLVQCLELGYRLFFVLLLASQLCLYAIVFEKAENAWLRSRTFAVVPAFIFGLAAAIVGGMLAVVEFGLPAFCGCVIATVGVIVLRFLVLYWHYRCAVDYVEITASEAPQ